MTPGFAFGVLLVAIGTVGLVASGADALERWTWRRKLAGRVTMRKKRERRRQETAHLRDVRAARAIQRSRDERYRHLAPVLVGLLALASCGSGAAPSSLVPTTPCSCAVPRIVALGWILDPDSGKILEAAVALEVRP